MELNDIIESIDIVDFISMYVELEEKNGEFWGLSPFKDEKTPSFSVRRETGRFYDFSSGIGGNVFTFVKFINNCSSKEAVDILVKYTGADPSALKPREKMQSTVVCKKFLPPVKHHKQKKTGTFADNCMEKYEKRTDKLEVWEREGISYETMEKFQVYYDAFSNRLVYPIRNIDGKIVNIGGRTLDPLWKEKELRKYTYFSGWGEMNVIYGLFENLEEIKKKNEVIIFEGAKSVMIAYTWGIRNTAALLTSHLNPEQMKLLARLGVHVVFALDKEVDITKDHNIKKLANYINIWYLHDPENLLEDKDSPVDKGYAVFENVYGKRKKYNTFERSNRT